MLATHGDTHLGGDNIDLALADWMLDQMKLITPATFELKAMLLQVAEKTKITLSKIKQTKIFTRMKTLSPTLYFRAYEESLIEGQKGSTRKDPDSTR